MKVFNIGVKPLVFKRSFDGPQCIHPNKYLTFGEDEGKKLIAKFKNAVSEDDYKKIVKDRKKEAEELAKKEAEELKKKGK